MSGDPSLKEPVIFYTDEMTESKIMLLRHQGVKFKTHKYYKLEEDVEFEY